MLELRILHLDSDATGYQLTVTLKLEKRFLKAHANSDTLAPTRLHFLIVSVSLGAIFFKTTTWDKVILGARSTGYLQTTRYLQT